MKLLKYALIGLGGILAIVLIVGLFIPTEYSVSREVTINRSKAEVFDYARMLEIVVGKHGWRGHIGIEYEGGRLSEPDGIKATRELLARLGCKA